MSRPQRVAVIGSGAVGSYYGARLAQIGHDVTFLMRRDYDAVRAHGLHVASCDGDFVLAAPNVVRDSRDIGHVDWVLCALKATALDAAEALIAPCMGPDTRVFVLMNGLGLEERFAEWFGADRIFGGLAFTCINRGEPGTVHHLMYGLLTVGHLLDDPAELDLAKGLWEGCNIPWRVAASIVRARWEKLCWNIPFNGLAVAAGGLTVDRILADPALRAEARALMEEVVHAGNTELAARGIDSRIDGPPLIQLLFDLSEPMGPYRPSTLIDFQANVPMEIDVMFAEPLRRAEAVGAAIPRITMLTALLQALNPGD